MHATYSDQPFFFLFSTFIFYFLPPLTAEINSNEHVLFKEWWMPEVGYRPKTEVPDYVHDIMIIMYLAHFLFGKCRGSKRLIFLNGQVTDDSIRDSICQAKVDFYSFFLLAFVGNFFNFSILYLFFKRKDLASPTNDLVIG